MDQNPSPPPAERPPVGARVGREAPQHARALWLTGGNRRLPKLSSPSTGAPSDLFALSPQPQRVFTPPGDVLTLTKPTRACSLSASRAASSPLLTLARRKDLFALDPIPASERPPKVSSASGSTQTDDAVVVINRFSVSGRMFDEGCQTTAEPLFVVLTEDSGRESPRLPLTIFRSHPGREVVSLARSGYTKFKPPRSKDSPTPDTTTELAKGSEPAPQHPVVSSPSPSLSPKTFPKTSRRPLGCNLNRK